jgi:hypothetical protein
VVDLGVDLIAIVGAVTVRAAADDERSPCSNLLWPKLNLEVAKFDFRPTIVELNSCPFSLIEWRN